MHINCLVQCSTYRKYSINYIYTHTINFTNLFILLGSKRICCDKYHFFHCFYRYQCTVLFPSLSLMSILHSPAVLQDRLQKNLFTPHQKSLVSPFLEGKGFLDDGKKWSQRAEVQPACHFSLSFIRGRNG